jgi:hypothetical protein
MLWLNPSDNQGVRFLIDDVQAGLAWQSGGTEREYRAPAVNTLRFRVSSTISISATRSSTATAWGTKLHTFRLVTRVIELDIMMSALRSSVCANHSFT